MFLVKLSPAPTTYMREIYGPVRVLWAQVLKRAIFDYVMLRDSRKLKDRRDYISAERWLFSSDVGLVDACKVFGWPLEKLRNRAKEMTKIDIRKMEFKERDCFTTNEFGELVEISNGNCR